MGVELRSQEWGTGEQMQNPESLADPHKRDSFLK